VAFPCEIVLDCLGVDFSNEGIVLRKIEDSVDKCILALFLLLEEQALAEVSIGETLAGEVEKRAFAFQLLVGVEDQMCHEAIGSVDGFNHFALHKLSREKAMLGEEDIVAVHVVVGVGADD
jgi:hypothetical protein